MMTSVAGLERFVGDIKRCYRQPTAVYADVEAHHARYHAANGGQLVEKRIVTPNELNDFRLRSKPTRER